MKLISKLPQGFPSFIMMGGVLEVIDSTYFDKKGWNTRVEEMKVKINQLSTEEIRNNAIFRAYRDFYWHHVGLDPTKTRPSSEALTRRLQKKGDLPQIHPIVDAFNLTSVETKITVCAYDADLIKGDLIVRLSEEGEEFLGIGMKKPQILAGGIVVIVDEGMSEKSEKLVSLYPYRDGDRTKLTKTTKKALITVDGVPGIEKTYLKDALDKTYSTIKELCQVELIEAVELK